MTRGTRAGRFPWPIAIGAFATALLLAFAAGLRVRQLEREALERWGKTLRGGAVTLAVAIDEWVAERRSDAIALAEVVAIHAAAPSADAPDSGARILRLQISALQRRGNFSGIWMFDASGRLISSVGGLQATAGESGAAREALRARTVQVAGPDRLADGSIGFSIAAPIVSVAPRRSPGPPVMEGAVVARTNLASALAALGRSQLNRGMIVGVAPAAAGDSLVALYFCGSTGRDVCLGSARDYPMARLAAARSDTFVVLPSSARGGDRLLSATYPLRSLPWGVIRRIDEQTAFAPLRAEVRLEGLAAAALVVMLALAFLAINRTLQAHRLAELARANERHRASEARFESLVDSLNDIIITMDREQRYTGVFGRWMERSTRDPKQMLGMRTRDIIGAEAAATPEREAARALAGEHVHFMYEWPGSETAPFAVFDTTISPMRSDDGTVTEIVSVSRDITELATAQRRMEWHHRILEQIVADAPLDEVLKLVANYAEAQSRGARCAIHLLSDEGGAPRLAAGAAPTVRDRTCWEAPIRASDGQVLGALAIYAPETCPPGARERQSLEIATQLAGIAAERASARESLRKSEASFRSFVENSPIGIYRATRDGRFLSVNASLVQLLGYPSAAALMRVDMARQLYRGAGVRDALLKIFDTQGDVHTAEVEWRRWDGRLVSVRISARAYRDERGVVLFSEGFVEDVTPLRAAEQALRQSEKLAALGQLVSGVAHELNNPLTAILHFAEDLLDDQRSAADAEALGVIRDQARRSRAIVRDLLSFVRLRDASRERLQVAPLILAAAKALGRVVEGAGARLETNVPTLDVWIDADRAGLEQVITNLVVNACQAVSGRPSAVQQWVRISCRAVDDELLIIVEDSGPGVPREILDRIFEPFFTTKGVGEGTGLGLSVSLGIVQQLGGRLTVENRSNGQGGGARFVVALPLAASTEPATSTPAAAQAPLTPMAAPAPPATPDALRVLIIDDEPAIRAALRRFFARRGWEVVEASDGASALAVLLGSGNGSEGNGSHADFTAIICDLKMPGCSGVDLHDRVAGAAPGLLRRIIFSTGDVASREAAEFVQRTSCTVLQKPFELRMLDDVVTRMQHGAVA
ncbi:MAG TPA: ATP-binding protein [Gemmatimonadaceae bacterium]|nr:ATP-binding protein [Gemmatimonadaceae bacterium]